MEVWCGSVHALPSGAMKTSIGAAARQAVIDDTALGGRELCRALSAATDAWLVALYDAARDEHPRAPQVALLAIGGYGRGELAPYSDLDLLIVHGSTAASRRTVRIRDLVPVVGRGIEARPRRPHGRAIRSTSPGATSTRRPRCSTARLIAGDATLAAKVIDAGRSNWAKHSKRWLGELQLRVRERQARCRRGRVHAGARSEGRAWRPARCPIAVVGGAGRAGAARRRRRRARRVLRDVWSARGSRCIAPPVGRATCCVSRIRTRRPPDRGTRLPTR